MKSPTRLSLALVAALAGCSGGQAQVEETPRPPDVLVPPTDPIGDAGTPPPSSEPPDAGPKPPPAAGAPVPANLTVEERVQITSSALELALVEKAIPDYALLKDPKNVVLSVENLEGAAPKVKGVQLLMMSADEIQAKADREGDLLHLAFGQIQAEADGAIRVSLRTAWALGTASRKAGKIIMSGGGFMLRFRRDGAGWKREVLMKWIS